MRVKKRKTYEEEKEESRKFEEKLTRKPSKRDLGLGIGLGMGVGIVLSEGSPVLYITGWWGIMLQLLVIVSFFCFCISMGLLLQTDSGGGQ